MANERGGPQHKLSGYDGVRIRHVFEDAVVSRPEGGSPYWATPQDQPVPILLPMLAASS
jgi:hypothetical protein